MITINFQSNSGAASKNEAQLVIRPWQGKEDLPKILEIATDAQRADKVDYYETLQQLTQEYASFHHCNLEEDFRMVEADGLPVAYARTEWDEDETGNIVFSTVLFIKQAWRSKGLGTTLIQWMEAHNRQIAAEKHPGKPCFISAFTEEKQVDKIALLEKHGYQVARNFYVMKRPLASLPEIKPMPQGVVVRPPSAADEIRKVWDAEMLFFKGHYGYVAPQEKDFYNWQKMPDYYQPELWQIAWHGDDVIGTVLNFINKGENETYNRLRGWTEDISVHPAWRGQGIASGLIVRSMHMHKALGMQEVALNVDTDNATGALRLYEGLGYAVIHKNMDYRKPLA